MRVCAPRRRRRSRARTCRRVRNAARRAPRAALASAAPSGSPRRASKRAPARALTRFEELIALAAEKRDIAMKSALERDVRLVRFEDGQLEIALEASAPKTLVGDLQQAARLDRPALDGRRLRRTGRAVAARAGGRAQGELKHGVRSDPLVQAVLTRFPGAEIVEVRPPAAAQPATTAGQPRTEATIDG